MSAADPLLAGRCCPRGPRAGLWGGVLAVLLGTGSALAQAQAPTTPVLPQPAPELLASCLAGLQPRAEKAGVPAASWRQITGGQVADMGVIALLDNQPEFRTPIWDYLAALVDEQRVAEGRMMLAQWRDTLAAVAQRHGVDAETVVAVWGVESDYGKSFGKRSLVNSLATLSCFGRRQDYFRGELVSLAGLLARGDIRPEQAVGSWAGAFGHTQFMPSTYERLAVDFDGDGRRDLVGSVPDALASTANFLKRAGWKTGQGWGVEVRLPPGFDASVAGRRAKRPLAAWVEMGLRRVDGQPLASGTAPLPGSVAIGSGAHGLLLPAGPKGPAFLVNVNFDAAFSYNAAESYALAITHLSDRLRGGAPFQTAWPTDDPGLGRAERRELQTLLLARGHAIGEVDGMLGAASRAAIRAEQQRLGWATDGRAGQKLLQALRPPGG